MAEHTDPVCGMKVDEKKAAGKSAQEGRDYYFCSRACEERFNGDPKQYVVNVPPMP